MAEYIEYHPLKFWLDPASIAEIVAHIQTYLVNNPINSTTEIETIIHDYLIAHPELIGGVDSVNGQTGEVVLTADNISGGENVTIKDVLDSLQDQIDDIVASIPSDYQQLIDDVSDLKSALNYLGEQELTDDDLTFADGYWTKTLTGFTASTLAKTSNAIRLNAGDTIIVSARMYNDTQCVLMKSTVNGTPIEYIYLGNGARTEYTYTATGDCYVIFSYWVSYGYSCTLYRNTFDQVYIVAKDGTGNFSSFVQMLKALKDNTADKTVFVYGGEYDIFDENGGSEFISSITNPSGTNWRDVNSIVPPNTTIIGLGDVKIKFYPTAEQIVSQDVAFLFSPLNICGSCHIENIKIIAGNCRYGIHIETSSIKEYDDAIVTLKNVTVDKDKGTYGLNPSIACGVGANEQLSLYNCIIKNDIGVCFTAHDNVSKLTDGATINFNNCVLIKKDGSASSGIIQLITGGGNHYALENDVIFSSCYIHGNVSLSGGNSSTKQKFKVTSIRSTITNGVTVDGTFSENPFPAEIY